MLTLILQILFTRRGFFDRFYFHETSHEEENVCQILKNHFEMNVEKIAQVYNAIASSCASTASGALRLLKLLCCSSSFEENFSAGGPDGHGNVGGSSAGASVIAPEQRITSDFAEGSEQLNQNTGQFSDIYFFNNPYLLRPDRDDRTNGAPGGAASAVAAFSGTETSRGGSGTTGGLTSGAGGSSTARCSQQQLLKDSSSSPLTSALKTVAARSHTQTDSSSTKRNKLHDFFLEVFCLDEARAFGSSTGQANFVAQMLNFGFLGKNNSLFVDQERFWLSQQRYPTTCQRYREVHLAKLVGDEYKLQNRFVWRTVPHCLAMFAQMLAAVAYLQKLRVVHHDLKPDNFFVDLGVRMGESYTRSSSGPGAGGAGVGTRHNSNSDTIMHPYFGQHPFPHVVVADFGEASVLADPEDEEGEAGEQLSLDSRIGWQQFGTSSEKARGAIELQPPEMALQSRLQNRQGGFFDRRKKIVAVGLASDIWSCGVLFYHILTGSPPYTEGEVITLGLQKARPTLREEHLKKLENCRQLEKFLRAVLVRDVKHRPHIGEVQQLFHGALMEALLQDEQLRKYFVDTNEYLKFPAVVQERQGKAERAARDAETRLRMARAESSSEEAEAREGAAAGAKPGNMIKRDPEEATTEPAERAGNLGSDEQSRPNKSTSAAYEVHTVSDFTTLHFVEADETVAMMVEEDGFPLFKECRFMTVEQAGRGPVPGEDRALDVAPGEDTASSSSSAGASSTPHPKEVYYFPDVRRPVVLFSRSTSSSFRDESETTRIGAAIGSEKTWKSECDELIRAVPIANRSRQVLIDTRTRRCYYNPQLVSVCVLPPLVGDAAASFADPSGSCTRNRLWQFLQQVQHKIDRSSGDGEESDASSLLFVEEVCRQSQSGSEYAAAATGAAYTRDSAREGEEAALAMLDKNVPTSNQGPGTGALAGAGLPRTQSEATGSSTLNLNDSEDHTKMMMSAGMSQTVDLNTTQKLPLPTAAILKSDAQELQHQPSNVDVPPNPSSTAAVQVHPAVPLMNLKELATTRSVLSDSGPLGGAIAGNQFCRGPENQGAAAGDDATPEQAISDWVTLQVAAGGCSSSSPVSFLCTAAGGTSSSRSVSGAAGVATQAAFWAQLRSYPRSSAYVFLLLFTLGLQERTTSSSSTTCTWDRTAVTVEQAVALAHSRLGWHPDVLTSAAWADVARGLLGWVQEKVEEYQVVGRMPRTFWQKKMPRKNEGAESGAGGGRGGTLCRSNLDGLGPTRTSDLGELSLQDLLQPVEFDRFIF